MLTVPCLSTGTCTCTTVCTLYVQGVHVKDWYRLSTFGIRVFVIIINTHVIYEAFSRFPFYYSVVMPVISLEPQWDAAVDAALPIFTTCVPGGRSVSFSGTRRCTVSSMRRWGRKRSA